MPPLCAVYRVQFSQKFGFDDAAGIADYLELLGISHLYASPWLMARPGSIHGYDLIDPGQFNSELGDEAAFARLTEALRKHELGHVLDFIPNHMGVGGSDNSYWLDVLEWGPESEYADWFDIDWDASNINARHKILIPFLGDQYGVELQAGKLRLDFDAHNGSFAVWAYENHKLPICPRSYALVLGSQHPDLERLGDAFANLPSRRNVRMAADELKAELVKQTEKSAINKELRNCISRFNGEQGHWDSWKNLDNLIQHQHWRPAHFRVAADDINYRRFFNVNELAGVRMENPEVFDHMHRLALELLKAGDLAGLRIDHVDGLFDPQRYLDQLRSAMAQRAASVQFVWVEKILAQHEGLRKDWPVDGTTGYEFGAEVMGLLVDPAGEKQLTQTYIDFTGERRDFQAILAASKLHIVDNELAGELRALARESTAIARQNPKSTDFTENVLQRALKQIAVSFPIYRTYISGRTGASEEDLRDLQWALERAKTQEPEIDHSVFNFVGELLSGELAVSGSGYSRTAVLRCAMRFQQYTVPLMAKGLEDTAFFRYPRLLALNEVGGRPDQFGLAPSSLHKANANRQKWWPRNLLTTSTHDTKFGEDVRARLAVLSEIPDEWDRHVKAWTRILRVGIGGTGGDAYPDRNDEYFFYQLLVGTWPEALPESQVLLTGISDVYLERIRQAMTKAAKEAKVWTSWAAPNEEYESALIAFVERALDIKRSHTFLSQFLPFQKRVANLGIQNSLAQTVIKLTAPGIPDIYQGSELWNFNMMDPDNRRPVDFSSLKAFLTNPGQSCAIKLNILATILRFRHKHPDVFSDGEYRPIYTEGVLADCIFAYARSHRLIVITVRFPARRERTGSWGDTKILLTDEDLETEWKNLLTEELVTSNGGGLEAAAILGSLPVAILVPIDS